MKKYIVYIKTNNPYEPMKLNTFDDLGEAENYARQTYLELNEHEPRSVAPSSIFVKEIEENETNVETK